MNEKKGASTGDMKKKEPSSRKKPSPMKCFANGEIVEGVNQFKVLSQIRKSSRLLDHDVYVVKDVEADEEYRMKVARKDLQILKVHWLSRRYI